MIDAFHFLSSSIAPETVINLLHSSFSSLTTTSPNSLLLASLDYTQSLLHAHTDTNAPFSHLVILIENMKESLRNESMNIFL
jgi:arginine/lysine/ornithine decarboxylase